MHKLIAQGAVKDEANEKLIAAVYVKLNEDGSESTTAGDHYVTVSYKKFEEAKMPADAVRIADLGEMVVPGYDGHADVTVGTATAVFYSKTKSFLKDEKAQVYASFRFNY